MGPAIAAVGLAAARILPMVASTVGRGAAMGAARMGASEGMSSLVGKAAQGQTIRGGVHLMDKMSGGGGGGMGSGPESRRAAFSTGATSSPW